MERDNYRNYNLLCIDMCSIVGCYNDLVDYYRAVAKSYFDELDTYDYDCIIEVIDLLKKLDRGLKNGLISGSDILQVDYVCAPNGEWYEFYKLERKEVK